MDHSKGGRIPNDVDSESFAYPFCYCGRVAQLNHSWTAANPGRRFFGCSGHGVRGDSCRFFLWFDPSVPPHASRVMFGLLKRMKEAESRREETEVERDRAKKRAKLYLVLMCLVSVLLGAVLVS